MKIIYDPRTYTLSLVLKNGPVAESDEVKPGIILDYDAEGDLVSVEILDVSKRALSPKASTSRWPRGIDKECMRRCLGLGRAAELEATGSQCKNCKTRPLRRPHVYSTRLPCLKSSCFVSSQSLPFGISRLI